MQNARPAPDPAPTGQQPVAPIGRDWIAAGAGLLLLGWLAGRTPAGNVAGYANAILIGGGVTVVLGAAMLRRNGSSSTRPWRGALQLLPRLVVTVVAVALIAGSLATPPPQPCPPEAGIRDGGTLIHSRFAGDFTVCTYDYIGSGSSL